MPKQEIKENIKPIIERITKNKIVKLYPLSEDKPEGPNINKTVSFSFITEKLDKELFDDLTSPVGSKTIFDLIDARIGYLVAKINGGMKMCLSGKREVIESIYESIHAQLEEQQEAQTKMQAQTL